ncbi:hypothetical protein HYALB_00003120 [Hymenoscyphus albidus]|uniref:Uncharacterized protein n=1 Tax=Hymenoscyphus albidus TaxID=595503 RepID=A0A9N9LFG1_9HELO|nr:hypothetical protein HYALB_00003120 [Hymenoscyphus albidus]
MPKDFEMGTLVNYIWQVNADIVQDIFEGELYGLLAYQLMRMSLPLGIPAHLKRHIIIEFSNDDGYWESDMRLVEQWTQEFPQAHDQYGRFVPVYLEKIYSILHQPFQDDQPEYYFPSDLSLLDRQEEYCLELLFLHPCGAASTTEYTTTAKRGKSGHEQDTELSLDSSSRHISPDEFGPGPIIEEEEDTSNADEKVASIAEKEVEDLQLFMDFLSL